MQKSNNINEQRVELQNTNNNDNDSDDDEYLKYNEKL